jgi:uncharacterized iron-regulated membrane protein
MIQALGAILLGLLLIAIVGAGIVGYIIWRSKRRMDDAVQEAAAAANPGIWGGK